MLDHKQLKIIYLESLLDKFKYNILSWNSFPIGRGDKFEECVIILNDINKIMEKLKENFNESIYNNL